MDRSWLLTATIRQLARGTADDSATHGMYSEAYDKKAFVDICHYMELQMRIDSEDVCVQARDYVKVRGFWYLSVLAGLRAWQLYETGCPVLFHNTKYDLEHWERESRTVFNKMLRAYAAGAEDLLPALMKFSPERKKTEALFRIMQGETGEELVTEVENWEWAEMREAFLAILSSDGKALKKAVLAMIRHDRKMYDLNRTMVDEYAYACLRLAKERGMKMETVAAVEVLEGRFDYPPVDREVFQLPYEDEIDAWLSSHGKEG